MPNLPWEVRPAGCNDVVWRYSKNPVIPYNAIDCSSAIFNSAAVPFNGGFAGVIRCDDKTRRHNIHIGFSSDGMNWDIGPKPIEFITDPVLAELDDEQIRTQGFTHDYDPRVIKIDDRYYITWCRNYHGPTIGMAYTDDFEKFYRMENCFMPCCRNGVLFPRKVNGKYLMLNRPSDMGQTPFGDIFYLESPDLMHWGKPRFVMGTKPCSWESVKIGPGPVPIETKEGWLTFYHGVHGTCNGYIYCMGAALLDLDEPWRVIRRAKPYLLFPEASYECVGAVPNVIFPCANIVDADTGKIAIYYGAADTVVGLAFAYVDEVLTFIKENAE